ncbi:hypothetical protein F2Q70_00028873 [Brassica cretica]|uniref:DNA repair metallo-beta-lactamase domain-containing protein n=1 Tax=Brassica cretica TaxID=69181 RepID=A0A8S9L7K1_BRACR|nr:hypothetical protein F2Q70_00028873 [Brassica cretica]
MEKNKDQAVIMSENNNNNKAQDPNPRFASEGCSVLLDVNDGDRLVFARLSGGAVLKIGNKNYSLKPLIGAPFGSLFQVETGEDGSFLSRILPVKKESSSNNVIDDARDNRELIDNNEAQNLTGEEIEAMRREGAKGDEIIEALIANSKTFDQKFQLSQTLFLIGSYTIGKERLFLEVARVLREKIYINPAKLKLLECLGFSKEDMRWFTVKEEESHIHVVPLWTLASFKRLKHIANRYTNRYSLIVAFSPTGWTSGKSKKKSPGRRLQQGTIIRYEVPYSEHSSFTELKEFVQQVSPEVIIPSVNNDGPDSAAAMVSMLLT